MSYFGFSEYRGSFKQNSYHGKGVLTEFEDNGKSIYEGDFNESYAHGHGKKTYANGDVYDGSW